MTSSLTLKLMQLRNVLRLRCLLAAVFSAAVLVAPGDGAFAQRSPSGSSTTPAARSNDAVILSSTVPAAQIFSCGSGFSFFQVGISAHGNVASLVSPSGVNHIFEGPRGYGVCNNLSAFEFPVAADFGDSEYGWAAAISTSQPNGPNTFPLEITRTTADGTLRVTRRFTGNSFVGPVTKGNVTYDNINANAQGCDVLGECGNCTNRTIHVLTRVTNLTTGALGVAVIEYVKIDADGDFQNWWGRTGDSFFAWRDRGSAGDTSGDPLRGILVQSLVTPADPAVYAFDAEASNAGDCAGSLGGTVITTPAFGDNYGYLLQKFGTLGAGANTGGAIRTHYRRN